MVYRTLGTPKILSSGPGSQNYFYNSSKSLFAFLSYSMLTFSTDGAEAIVDKTNWWHLSKALALSSANHCSYPVGFLLLKNSIHLRISLKYLK